MAIKINTHWIKTAWLTALQCNFLQTLLIERSQKKMTNHENAKTEIEKTSIQVILSRK